MPEFVFTLMLSDLCTAKRLQKFGSVSISENIAEVLNGANREYLEVFDMSFTE